MTKKYLLKPGYVPSIDGSEPIYISPLKLTKLYNVDIHDCIIFDKKLQEVNKAFYSSLQILEPQEDGNYTLEEKDG
jgi:hypothetical protein